MIAPIALVGLFSLAPLAAEESSLGDQFASAIERANLAAVKALIEAGAAADTPIEYGPNTTTPLIKAAWEGRTAIAKYLIEQGAKVNATSSDGADTPLSQAATRGHDDLIELLLKSGADAKTKNKDGYTAFTAALFNGQMDAADMLLAAGADVNNTDTYGITPLMTASSICNPESLRYLVGKGAKLDRITQLEYGGSTALTTAASTGQVACVKTLLELGANPNLKMKNGNTALTSAQEAKNPEIIEILKAAMAKAPAKATAKPPAKN